MSDGNHADEYAHYVGLPPQLTTELETFAKNSGLLDAFRSVIYGSKPSGDTFETKGNHGKWAITSSDQGSDLVNSDKHWFDPVNEEGLEEMIQALKEGDVNAVLESVRDEFDSSQLTVYDVGFTIVSYCASRNAGENHGSNDELFHLMIPLFSENEKAGGGCIVPVDLTKNVGLILSGDTSPRVTGKCDYRASKGLGIVLSVFIAEDNEEEADVNSKDTVGLTDA